MTFPQELRYSAEHEWVRIDGDIATIGITEFAQSELGDIVYVEAPKIGQAFKAGEIFGSVEAVKTVSDLFIPLSGIRLSKCIFPAAIKSLNIAH